MTEQPINIQELRQRERALQITEVWEISPITGDQLAALLDLAEAAKSHHDWYLDTYGDSDDGLLHTLARFSFDQ